MASYDNRHEFMDGKIVLYTRNNHPTWHARLKIEGLDKYVVKSTKRTSLAEAKGIAESLYIQFSYKVQNKLETGTHTFGTLYKRFIEAHKVELSDHRFRYIDGTAKRYLLPYFGKYSLAQLTDALIERYWDWRRNFWSSEAGLERIETAQRSRPTKASPHKSKLGNVAKVPAAKSLSMEQTVLRQIFDWAIRTGAMNRKPHVKVPLQKKHGVSRRPAFTEDEWQALYRHLRRWVGESDQGDNLPPPHNSVQLYHRKLLRNYVLFMQASGLRPNEARQLRWRDMKISKDREGVTQLFLSIAPTTKTGARTCVARRNAIEIVERMKLQNAHVGPNNFVFADREGNAIENFGKTFKSVLKDAELLKDSFGAERTIYSLRHTYATSRIANSDITLHDLATNMGTSPATLFAHYSHVTATQKAHIHGGTLHSEKSRKGLYL